VKTPGSRLRDDLYVLYLVALSWFVMPVYGNALALVLPSDAPMFGRWLDVAVAASGLVAIWWGIQGGPLVVSRAAVVHELGSPASRMSVLLPRLARQALTGATFAAVGGALLLAINGGVSHEISAPALVSVVCAAAVAAMVLQAALWLVIVHGHAGPRFILGIAGAVPPVAVIAFVAAGESLTTGIGIGIVWGGAVLSGILATIALTWIPVDRLWRRAAGLESMRSAMQTFDFQRLLLDLRRASDRPQPSNLRLARSWMPLPLWRQLATMQHTAARHAVRLAAAAAALAAIVFFAEVREGLVLLAVAACSGFLGFEFAGALSATADQSVFLVHYRRGSGHVLRGQLVTMLVLTLGVGAAAVGWQCVASPLEAVSTLVLCGFGALGAALQARLGSPNIGAYVDLLGLGAIGPVLWLRAMLGPTVVFVCAVALSHGVLRPSVESTDTWIVVLIVTAAVAAFVVTWPLEKRPA
jgi:hypothetical protein